MGERAVDLCRPLRRRRRHANRSVDIECECVCVCLKKEERATILCAPAHNLLVAVNSGKLFCPGDPGAITARQSACVSIVCDRQRALSAVQGQSAREAARELWRVARCERADRQSGESPSRGSYWRARAGQPNIVVRNETDRLLSNKSAPLCGPLNWSRKTVWSQSNGTPSGS